MSAAAQSVAGRAAGEAGTWGSALAAAAEALAAQSDSPRLDAELLLAEVVGCRRERLYARPETALTSAERARFEALVARRLAGEPVAYVVGRREFWSLELEVTPATLVPRPETECLVEAALAALPERAPCRVAELGTGAGGVAIAIARERPRAELLASDCSRPALAVAARNVARLAPGRVALRHGDWTDVLEGRFDLILCNPPYVASGDAHLARLGCEPRIALDGGRDGLAAIRRIAEGAGEHLSPGGRLVLEHGFDQGGPVRALLRALGYRVLASRRDAAGHARVVEASVRGSGV